MATEARILANRRNAQIPHSTLSYRRSTSVENPRQIDPFMQNKPNFDKGQNKPNPLYKKDLRKFYTPSDNEKQTQNKPNQTQFQKGHLYCSAERCSGQVSQE